jgi:hypothetical protein
MTISSKEASAILADIDSVVASVKQSRVYRNAGTILVIWGVIDAARALFFLAAPRWAESGWMAFDALGVAATIFLISRSIGKGSRFPLRPLGAFALFYGFGWMWADLIGHLEPRQLEAFWPTLFLFGFTLAGLWFGIVFLVIGLAGTALIVAAYFWSGAWFGLWIALALGGGFVVSGLWMRRA